MDEPVLVKWAAAALVVVLSCAKGGTSLPAPAPPVQVTVQGPVETGDSGAPRVSAAGRYVVVRGVADAALGAELYGDVDLSSPPLLRLTLYDSVRGRPLSAVPPDPPAGRRAVIFEARVGPVPGGEYEATVGRYRAHARLIVVDYPSQRVVVSGTGR